MDHWRWEDTWDSLLQFLHFENHLLKQQNTKKGTKSSCKHAVVGANYEQKIQKDQKPKYPF